MRRLHRRPQNRRRVRSSIWQLIFFLIFEWPFGAVDLLDPPHPRGSVHARHITLFALNSSTATGNCR